MASNDQYGYGTLVRYEVLRTELEELQREANQKGLLENDPKLRILQPPSFRRRPENEARGRSFEGRPSMY